MNQSNYKLASIISFINTVRFDYDNIVHLNFIDTNSGILEYNIQTYNYNIKKFNITPDRYYSEEELERLLIEIQVI